MRSKTISIRSMETSRSGKVDVPNDEKWSTAEGYTKILISWINVLEELGIQDVRKPALYVWAKYLKKLGLAFYGKREVSSRRSISSMSYRDKMHDLEGPHHVIELKKIPRKRTKKLAEATEDNEDDNNLTMPEIWKKRSMKRSAFYKSFSESFRVDTAGNETGAPQRDAKEMSDAKSGVTSLSEKTRSDRLWSGPRNTMDMEQLDLLANLMEDVESASHASSVSRSAGSVYYQLAECLSLANLRAILVI